MPYLINPCVQTVSTFPLRLLLGISELLPGTCYHIRYQGGGTSSYQYYSCCCCCLLLLLPRLSFIKAYDSYSSPSLHHQITSSY